MALLLLITPLKSPSGILIIQSRSARSIPFFFSAACRRRQEALDEGPNWAAPPDARRSGHRAAKSPPAHGAVLYRRLLLTPPSRCGPAPAALIPVASPGRVGVISVRLLNNIFSPAAICLIRRRRAAASYISRVHSATPGSFFPNLPL